MNQIQCNIWKFSSKLIQIKSCFELFLKQAIMVSIYSKLIILPRVGGWTQLVSWPDKYFFLPINFGSRLSSYDMDNNKFGLSLYFIQAVQRIGHNQINLISPKLLKYSLDHPWIYFVAYYSVVFHALNSLYLNNTLKTIQLKRQLTRPLSPLWLLETLKVSCLYQLPN